MALLDEAIEAHGGMQLWNQIGHFTVHASIDGALFTRKGKGGALKDVVLEGLTNEQCVAITGFTAPDRRCIYRPSRVAVETLDGVELESRDDPQASFAGHTDLTPWDDLHLGYFCGYANWNYFMEPFLFAEPGFVTVELPRWKEAGETWRRLQVVFPPDIATHSPTQTFYFDQKALLRRMDYQALDAGGAHIAHYTEAHRVFSGVVVPTVRRALRISAEGKVVPNPVSVSIQVFDAKFE